MDSVVFDTEADVVESVVTVEAVESVVPVVSVVPEDALVSV